MCEIEAIGVHRFRLRLGAAALGIELGAEFLRAHVLMLLENPREVRGIGETTRVRDFRNGE